MLSEYISLTDVSKKLEVTYLLMCLTFFENLIRNILYERSVPIAAATRPSGN